MRLPLFATELCAVSDLLGGVLEPRRIQNLIFADPIVCRMTPGTDYVNILKADSKVKSAEVAKA